MNGASQFSRQPRPTASRRVVEVGLAVMLEHDRVRALLVEHPPVHVSVLLRDGQERHRHDDPAHTVLLRVAQPEARAGERLPGTSGRTEPKHTRRLLGSG